MDNQIISICAFLDKTVFLLSNHTVWMIYYEYTNANPDEIPEASSDWALRVMIEKKRDYYQQGDPSLHPDLAAIQGEDP